MITNFLAIVIGWYLVITSLYLLLRYEQAKAAMTEVMEQRGLLFILAIITLILGLMMVTVHNVWVLAWPVIITLIAWLTLIGGIVRLFCPDTAIRMGNAFLNDPVKMKIAALIFLIIGLFLLFEVYSLFFYSLA
ncbi:hypothetical protein [Legionella shakespearei]|uniref:Integral membrane protein (PIN domain superfamily) n=1 Tax=Legionella shakespearei DSM 23087 TaxID=1122169 RepID=A0A0W0YHX8_9GAMM|nr:hypothetical protein [Legionella shakespearei]KTD56427.1 Integral membrane protein (PIN domain superfamily) [Legionella shakespearei DSM 23087]